MQQQLPGGPDGSVWILRHRLDAELMELADGGVQMATLPPILVQVERLQVREGMVHLAHAQIAQPIAGDVQLLQHAEPPLARVQHAQQVVVQQQGRQARQMQRPVGRDRLESVVGQVQLPQLGGHVEQREAERFQIVVAQIERAQGGQRLHELDRLEAIVAEVELAQLIVLARLDDQLEEVVVGRIERAQVRPEHHRLQGDVLDLELLGRLEPVGQLLTDGDDVRRVVRVRIGTERQVRMVRELVLGQVHRLDDGKVGDFALHLAVLATLQLSAVGAGAASNRH
uniref:Uncharacterized protein n=1 Tax=Anopheles merus TaxID=30066 RepID=A0A182VJR2_ANOME